MIGEFWSTGITLKWSHDNHWWASAKWQDDGHCMDNSAWLKMETAYAQPIKEAIDTLMKDAANLKLKFVGTLQDSPMLYIENEDAPNAPDDWREILQTQARRIGWSTYESGKKS